MEPICLFSYIQSYTNQISNELQKSLGGLC